MIAAYLRQLEELLSTSVVVSDVEVVRRSIRDTDLEKVLNYRYRVRLANGGLIEMTERVLERQGALEVTKYRHHWQDSHGLLVKRLQQHALPGTLLISAATYALVQEEVESASADALDVAGLPGPVPVYTVEGLRQRRAGVTGHGARVLSHFVGRAREVALLQTSLAQVAQGQGQVVGVVGDPGMGKSRLLAEFRRSLAGQSVTYYEGHCLPCEQATPYLPVRDVVRQYCEISATDPPEAVAVAVHHCVQEAGLRPEEATPVLLQLLDVPVQSIGNSKGLFYRPRLSTSRPPIALSLVRSPKTCPYPSAPPRVTPQPRQRVSGSAAVQRPPAGHWTAAAWPCGPAWYAQGLHREPGQQGGEEVRGKRPATPHVALARTHRGQPLPATPLAHADRALYDTLHSLHGLPQQRRQGLARAHD